MKTDDNYQPGSEVEPKLLLQYLIEKCGEMSHGNRLGFSLPFRGLGLSVLDPFSDLKKEFLTIMSESEEPVSERAKKCRQLFVEALARPQPLDSNSHTCKGSDDHRFERVVSNRFAWEARREGEAMVERENFEFIQVWECMAWIGLHGDAEKFKDFQEKCLQYTDPEEKIEQVIPLLWAVMTRKPRKH
jgi:hypothetical protein